MPFAAAAPLIAAVAGPLMGAVAGGQGPRGQSQQFNQKEIIDMLTQSTSSQSGQSSFQNFNQAIEDPRFSAFRSSLLPLFGQEFNKTQQPIYGEGQRAKTLQDINAQFEGVPDNIAQQLGARGQLNSGLLPFLNMESELAGAGQRANFLSSLPMLEEQARRQSSASLLGQGMGFAGRAPVSQLSSGNQQSTQQALAEQLQQGTNETFGTSNTNVKQPPLWQRLLGAGAGVAGNIAGPNPFGGFGGFDDFNLSGAQSLPNVNRGYTDFSITSPSFSFGGGN